MSESQSAPLRPGVFCACACGCAMDVEVEGELCALCSNGDHRRPYGDAT